MFDYPVYLYIGREQICSSCCPCPSYLRWGKSAAPLPGYSCRNTGNLLCEMCASLLATNFRNRDAPDRAPAFSMAGSEFALQREVYPHADGKNLGARTLGKLRTRRKLFPAKEAVCPAHQSHRFLGVLHPIISFLARTADRDHLSTHPQSAH